MGVDLKSYLGRVTVADGAWGTMLCQPTDTLTEPVELLNLAKPDAVRNVAAAYVEAGSQIILTNTFRANRFILASYDAADRVAEIHEVGARLSREAAQDQARVFGSIGPAGKMLMTGEITVEELYEVFAEQAAGLAAGNIDAIVCETFYDTDELTTALRAVKETTDLPVVACMTFDSGPDKTSTMMGVTPQHAAETLTDAGADAVGCNCGEGMDLTIRITRMMRPHTALPIWVKPNAGFPVVEGNRTYYRQTPEAFASRVPELIDAGANIIGGCCGTTPAFIQAVVATTSRLDRS